MSWLATIGWVALVLYGGGALLVGSWALFDYMRGRPWARAETIPTRELDPKFRNALEGIPNLWCSSCAMTELVCDLHPRVAFERCGCGEGVPRACPVCTEYDVTALLEELAALRTKKGATS